MRLIALLWILALNYGAYSYPLKYSSTVILPEEIETWQGEKVIASDLVILSKRIPFLEFNKSPLKIFNVESFKTDSKTGIHFNSTNTNQSGYTIYGKLIDLDNKPIIYKTIALIEKDSLNIIKQVLTDSLGAFRFNLDKKSLKAGNHQIIILNENREKTKLFKTLTIIAENLIYDMGTIKMEIAALSLSEVKIFATIPLLDRKLDKLVVNIENSILSSGNSLTEILQKLPGIKVDNDGGISVNGKQGVLILIDGKGQYVQKEQVQAIISSLRSESIKKLEIIANPSAKYDANQGSVINIITKKDYAKSDIHINYGTLLIPSSGINGFSYPSLGIGTNLNYKLNKFSSNISIDFNLNKSLNRTFSSDLFYNLNVVKNTNSTTTHQTRGLNLRWGASYDISKRSFLSFDAMLIKKPKSILSYISNINFLNSNKYLDSNIISNGITNNNRFGMFSLTTQYSLDLDTAHNKHLDVFYDLSNFKNPFNNVFDYVKNNRENAFINNTNFVSERFYKILFNSLKIDYEQKLSKSMTMYAGLKYSKTSTSDSSNAIQSYANKVDPLANGKYFYDETIAGAYIMASTKFNKLEGQFGLRSEYTNANGRTSNLRNISDQEYLNLFPSINLLLGLNETNKIGLSYNRRIVRLGFGDLNPISRYMSPFNISIGQPNLKPQFINYTEFSYEYKKLNMSLNYSQRSNSRLDIPLATNSAATITNEFTNIKKVKTAELNISYPFTITSWWTNFNNLTISNNTSHLPLDKTISYSSYSIYTGQNIKLSSTSSIEVSVSFVSKNQSYYTLSNSIFVVNTGYKKAFLNKKIDLTLNLSDLFGTNKFREISKFETQQSAFKTLNNRKNGNIGIRYNFNTGNSFGSKNGNSRGDFGDQRY